jgi:hypothetical protein
VGTPDCCSARVTGSRSCCGLRGRRARIHYRGLAAVTQDYRRLPLCAPHQVEGSITDGETSRSPGRNAPVYPLVDSEPCAGGAGLGLPGDGLPPAAQADLLRRALLPRGVGRAQTARRGGRPGRVHAAGKAERPRLLDAVGLDGETTLGEFVRAPPHAGPTAWLKPVMGLAKLVTWTSSGQRSLRGVIGSRARRVTGSPSMNLYRFGRLRCFSDADESVRYQRGLCQSEPECRAAGDTAGAASSRLLPRHDHGRVSGVAAGWPSECSGARLSQLPRFERAPSLATRT